MTPEQKAAARDRSLANLAKARAAKVAKAIGKTDILSPGPLADAAEKAAASAAPQTYLAPDHVSADPELMTAPASYLPSLLKAIADLSAEVAQLRASPPPLNPPIGGGSITANLPPGANPYAFLPLELVLREALLELGAIVQPELGVAGQLSAALPTSRLAAHIAARGFPKSRGRTYEGDEHADEICTALNSLVMQNKRMGMVAPLAGWFHYAGGHAAGSPDNWQWAAPAQAVREAAAQGRIIEPRASAAAATPMRAVGPGGPPRAYAEDMLPGKRTADEIMAGMPKLETQTIER